MLAFQRKFRRSVVWLVVIGSHGAMIFLLVRSEGLVDREVLATIDEITLTLVPEDEAMPRTPVALAPRRKSPQEAVAPIADPQTAPIPAPAPDFHAAAERAAQRALSGGPDKPRDFLSTPQSPFRDCQRRENNFEWKPNAKRTGWAGGLPYVRMGKRCVVGLGFFGCAVGELPPADGGLLEDMNTSNRMDGTVPGTQDCLVPIPAPETTPAK